MRFFVYKQTVSPSIGSRCGSLLVTVRLRINYVLIVSKHD